MDVAVVDYTDPDAPAKFTRSLKETGFGVITNHPLPQVLVKYIYDEWLAFFDGEAKHNYRYTSESLGGYYPPDISETAKGNHIRDLKEFFHVYETGVYPKELTNAALKYRQIAKEVATTLLTWVHANTPADVAAGFSMPLPDMMIGSTQSLLRVLRYPPLRGDEPAGAVRAAAHEDINLLTVLPASNESGLQVKEIHGNWHDVPCDFGSIAINSGDMLHLASQGYYPSTTHRVMNPVGESATRSRLSLPMFLHPANNVVLDVNGPSGRRTASEFLQERLRELRSQDSPK